MTTTPNIGTVGASVQKSTQIQSAQPGSSGVQRSGFNYAPKFSNWNGVKIPKNVANQPSYNLDFNMPYAQFNQKYLTPNYTPSEFLALGSKGYVGAFTNKNKTVLGLMGPAYTTQRALVQLRSGKKITPYTDYTPLNEYGTHGINIAGNAFDAARVPTTGDVTSYVAKANKFTTKYGADGAKYVQRYGHMPDASSSFGDLFSANTQGVIDNAVSSFRDHNYTNVMNSYQNSLVQRATQTGQALRAYAAKVQDKAPDVAKAIDLQGVVVMQAATNYSTDKSKTGNYSNNSIKQLQSILKIGATDAATDPHGYLSADQRWNKTIVDTINASMPSQTDAAAKALSGDAINVLTVISPAIGGILHSDAGKKALVKVSELAKPEGILAPSKVNYDKPLLAEAQISFNALKGLGRMSAGLPMGLYSTSLAISNTIGNISEGKWSGKDTHYGIDTSMFSAFKQDYTARYKTPFDSGFFNTESWKKFGNIAAADPTAPVLDALSVVPVIGWIAKGADLASIASKVGITGKLGMFDEATRLKYLNAQGIIGENAFNPVKWSGPFASSDVGKLQSVSDAQAFVNHINDAKLNINLKTYAGLLRQAHAGDIGAITQLDKYRKLGLVVPKIGKDASWTLKAAAKFEERTKEMLPPARAVNYRPGADVAAIRRMPASPVARGLMDATMVITRGIGEVANKVDIPTEGRVMGSAPVKTVTDVLMRLPHMPYNWQYSRALKSSFQYFAGDLATSGKLAHATLAFAEDSSISDAHQRAVLAMLSDGNGGSAFGRLHDPAYQRSVLESNKAILEKRVASGELSPNNATYQNDFADLNARLETLPDQAAYEKAASDLTKKLEDPSIVMDAQTEAAYAIHQKMQHLYNRVQRLVHGETLPQTADYLRMVYAEAMQGLKIRPAHLFGADNKWVKGGELYNYRNRVVIINDNFPLHEAMSWSHDAHHLVMPSNGDVSVFERISDPVVKKERVAQFNEFMKAVGQDGVFRDAIGSADASGRPVFVLAKGSKVTDSFVNVHVARLDGHIDAQGFAQRGRIVDTKNVYTIPKELLSDVKVQQHDALSLFEQGSLNAMHDYFPNPNFYSDKINEAGLMGEAKNFADVKNEHVVATRGLKAHTLRMHILSQKHYLRNRYERDLLPIAESNAELVPMKDFMGGKYKGGFLLKGVRVFDNVAAAEDYAKVRGVQVAFRDGVKAESNVPGSTIGNDPFSIDKGFGTIQRNGQTLYVVRGDVTDYAAHGLRDMASELNNHLDYRNVLYDMNPSGTVEGTYALVVPHHIDKVLKETVVEGNDYASRLLKHNAVASVTNIWKRLVLFGPHFIGSNVFGGAAMYLMHNPLMAGKMMLRMLAYGAKRAGVKDYAHIAEEGAVITHHMAYELDHNIFREDSGIRTIEDAKHMGHAKKYGWNGAYTAVAAFEHMMRTMVAKDFLQADPVFKAFMKGPEVKRYIKEGVDFTGTARDNITPFEAATDLTLDPASKYFNSHLKTRMRYTTNTVSGNYHSFSPTEQLVRNFLSPFYSWQRHSLAYTWRLPIDRPITANVLNNIGQYGYNQTLENGLPSWMDQTIPMPQVIENTFGLTPGDHRIDLSSINPFSTTADMAMAVSQLFTGQKLGANVFNFTHPILNGVIKSTLNIDPQTGQQINPADQTSFFQGIADTVMNTPALKIPKSLTYDAIQGVYADNALANKYGVVDAASILRNYDPHADPKKNWSLYVPKEKTTVQAGSYGDQLFNVLFPVRQYNINVDRMKDVAKKEAVAAGVLNQVQGVTDSSSIDTYVKGVQAWRTKRDYVMNVWLPMARKQGMSNDQIALVFNKLESEKTKAPSGLNFESTLQLLGG